MMAMQSTTYVEAAQSHRLAFSNRLGVEVLAQDNGSGWCQSDLLIRFIADDADFFEKPDFPKLITVIGQKVLPTECAQAKRMIISGEAKGGSDILYNGISDVDSEWSLEQTQAPQIAVSQPNSNNKIPAPPPPLEKGNEAIKKLSTKSARKTKKPTSPYIGEWIGTGGCRSTGKLILSIYEVEGSEIRAIEEFRRDNSHIERVKHKGFVDAGTNQFQISPIETIYPPNDTGAAKAAGNIDLKQQKITGKFIGCYGDSKINLTKQSSIAQLANRVLFGEKWRNAVFPEELSKARPGRLIGAQPKGKLRKPSCNTLLAWVNSYPVGQRIRLVNDSSSGMLRHFDDDTTIKFFGSPAYYWMPNDNYGAKSGFGLGLEGLLKQACGSSYRNKNYETVSNVLLDRNSRREIVTRRSLNNKLATMIPDHLSRGGEALELFDDVSKLDDVQKVNANIRNWGVDVRQLRMDDVQNIVNDAIQYKAYLADKMVDESITKISLAPETVEGLNDAVKYIAHVEEKIGNGEYPEPLIRLKTETRKGIGGIGIRIAESLKTQLLSLPTTLDGLKAANTMYTAFELQVGDAVSDEVLQDLKIELVAFQSKTRQGVVETEIAKLDSIEAGPKQALELRQNMVSVVDLVKEEPPLPALGEYKRAVLVRLENMGSEGLVDFKSDVGTLPTSWKSLDDLHAYGNLYLKAFANTKSEKAYAKAIADRRNSILNALADDAILEIKGMNAMPEEADNVMAYVSNAVAIFNDKKAAPQAKRITEVAQDYMEELLDAGYSVFKHDIENIVPTRSNAIDLSVKAIEYQRKAKLVPAWNQYYELAHEISLEMFKDSCEGVLDKADISSGDGETSILVGKNIVPLRDFICDLNEANFQVVSLQTPSLFGDDLYKLKLFKENSGFTSITFTELEIRPDVTALVGSNIALEDGAKRLSVKEWKRMSDDMVLHAKLKLGDIGAVCRKAKSQPTKLSLRDMAIVSLACNGD